MSIVFAVGTGRCGSLALYNILATSPTTLALHEGQSREPLSLTSINSYLPMLTLENFHAYLNPELAGKILLERRKEQIPQLLKSSGKTNLIEIAYYLSPFTEALYRIFPTAKLIYMVRHGADFVRSVYTDQNPDPTPVGYIDREELSPVEKFIEAGRLKVKDAGRQSSLWHQYSAFQKNAWLWAETNRIILQGLKAWPSASVMMLKLEEWQGNQQRLTETMHFLEIDDCDKLEVERIMKKKINSRKKTVLPDKELWNQSLKDQFMEIAGPMMEKLDYHL